MLEEGCELKKKLFIAISTMCLLISMILVGVWAVKSVDIQMGGSVDFVAAGISATISEGELSSTGSFVDPNDFGNKFKEIIITPSTNPQDLEYEYSSWKDLKLSFNEEGDDVTITFTITNTSQVSTEFLRVDVGISATTIKNATAVINSSSAFLNSNGDYQQFVITFKVIDKTANASLSGFKINFNMAYEKPLAVNADGSSADFNFTLGNEKNATLEKSNSETATSLVVPGAIQTPDNSIYKVTSMADGDSSSGVFYSTKSTLQSVSLPATMTDIGENAFSGCSKLSSINIPSSINSIKKNAFSGCKILTSIYIPSSVKNIDYSAFYGCNGLVSIAVDSGNPVYDSRNFCNAIIGINTNELIIGCKTTKIPSSVISIGNCAFDGCSGLTSIIIPSSVTRIGYYSFSGCTSLQNVEIPLSVNQIGNGAFAYCRALTSITIPANVNEIGVSAFSSCSSLATVIIESQTIASNSTYLSRLLVNDATKTVHVKNFDGGSISEYLEINFPNITSSVKNGYTSYTRS